MRHCFYSALLITTACGSSSPTGVDASASHVDASTVVIGDAPAGSNTITGMVNGKGFNMATTAFWIGSPDSPATDTVVYLFDATLACGDIAAAGWDTTIPTNTQILELKIVGKTAMAYPTTTAATHVPAPGESLSSYTIAASTATDQLASGGSVTLASIESPTAGHFATGTFQLTFANGSLDGTFDAPFCMAGREP